MPVREESIPTSPEVRSATQAGSGKVSPQLSRPAPKKPAPAWKFNDGQVKAIEKIIEGRLTKRDRDHQPSPGTRGSDHSASRNDSTTKQKGGPGRISKQSTRGAGNLGGSGALKAS